MVTSWKSMNMTDCGVRSSPYLQIHTQGPCQTHTNTHVHMHIGTHTHTHTTYIRAAQKHELGQFFISENLLEHHVVEPRVTVADGFHVELLLVPCLTS